MKDMGIVPTKVILSQSDKYRMLAEEEVKKVLKAPSTATFLYNGCSDPFEDGKSLLVDGYVDSENSFGAKIRDKYQVMFEKNYNSWEATLIHIGNTYYNPKTGFSIDYPN